MLYYEKVFMYQHIGTGFTRSCEGSWVFQRHKKTSGREDGIGAVSD